MRGTLMRSYNTLIQHFLNSIMYFRYQIHERIIHDIYFFFGLKLMCVVLWLCFYQGSIQISICQGGKNVALLPPHHLCSYKTRTPTTTLHTPKAPPPWRTATRSPMVTEFLTIRCQNSEFL